MTNLLEVKNLNVYYGNIHAIKGIDFYIKKGEIVSIIGANGAGKTTTLQSISGLIKAEKGEIYFKGENIKEIEAHKILELGIAQVPEGRRVFPNLTVRDNIHMGQYSLEDSYENLRDERRAFYHRFPRMQERKGQLAGTLSGGEQQMLAIGRALMSRPELLILDEPSMGLSPLFVKEIFQLIKDLNDEGITILLVEQNAKMALTISDRAYVIETGKIKLQGSGKEFLKDSKVKAAYLGA